MPPPAINSPILNERQSIVKKVKGKVKYPGQGVLYQEKIFTLPLEVRCFKDSKKYFVTLFQRFSSVCLFVCFHHSTTESRLLIGLSCALVSYYILFVKYFLLDIDRIPEKKNHIAIYIKTKLRKDYRCTCMQREPNL